MKVVFHNESLTMKDWIAAKKRLEEGFSGIFEKSRAEHTPGHRNPE